MPQLTGAWMRYAPQAIHEYALAIAPVLNHMPAHVTIERAAELAAWEAMRIAALPGYCGIMLEVVKDLVAIKEESDASKEAARKEAEREAVQLREVDEGSILRFPTVGTAPGVCEVGPDTAG